MQLVMDFNPVHLRENNAVSKAHLDEHRESFANDCYRVLCELVDGKRLTYKYAIDTGLSGDIRARIRDIRKVYKIPVSDAWITTEGGRKFKEYFMTEDDRTEAFRIILNQKLRKKVA